METHPTASSCCTNTSTSHHWDAAVTDNTSIHHNRTPPILHNSAPLSLNSWRNTTSNLAIVTFLTHFKLLCSMTAQVSSDTDFWALLASSLEGDSCPVLTKNKQCQPPASNADRSPTSCSVTHFQPAPASLLTWRLRMGHQSQVTPGFLSHSAQRSIWRTCQKQSIQPPWIMQLVHGQGRLLRQTPPCHTQNSKSTALVF